jgi:mannosyl-glycoprotein endo-beta-N-acetylglucosaminidase
MRTPEAAKICGAQFISSGYIYNSSFQQDTLYKMRWNPVQTWHQYATDIGWAYKQVDNIYNLYQLLDTYTLYYDLPKYQ